MKWIYVAALAVLACQAFGARSSRPGSRAAPHALLCERSSERRALAAEALRAKLQSLQEQMLAANLTAASLAREMTGLAAKIRGVKASQAQAASIRQREEAQLSTETGELQRLLEALREAIEELGTASQASFLQFRSGALAAVSRVLELLPSAARPHLPLLEAFVAASRAGAPEASAVRGALADIQGAVGKDLQAAERAQVDNELQFKAFAAEKGTELLGMEDAMKRREGSKQENEALLSYSAQSYSQAEAALTANAALFDKIKAFCDSKPKLVAAKSNSSTEALPETPVPARTGPGAGLSAPFQLPDAKELERMKEQMVAALANLADDSVATAVHLHSFGPYDMQAVVDIPISGFSGCSAPYKGNIYLPTGFKGGPSPPPGYIISFAHGFTQGGRLTDRLHREHLFRQLVAMGFVVVAHQTGGRFDYCDSSHDQVRMITWARTSPYADRINFTQAILMGFSMGGRATLRSASDASVVSANNVKAAVVYMPHCTQGCDRPVVPTHFFAGGLDVAAPWGPTYSLYESSSVDKVWALSSGSGHLPANAQWDGALLPSTATWLSCKVYHNVSACVSAFGRHESCQFGCQHCGCEACEPCSSCWEFSPHARCEDHCAPCGTCRSCDACSQCNPGPRAGAVSFVKPEGREIRGGTSTGQDPRRSGAPANATWSVPFERGGAGRRPFKAPDAEVLAEIRREVYYSLVASSADEESSTSPAAYAMEAAVDIDIPGFRGCSKPYKGNIYLPTGKPGGPEPGPGPLISFSHGFAEGGASVDAVYREALFRPLVGMGFVIVAHQTGGASDYCDSSHDQVQMITWSQGSPYASRIDFSKSVLMGVSMGGTGTLSNAGDPSVVAAFNVKAAVVYNPHCSFGCGAPAVPVHFFAGERDGVAPWPSTREVYDQTRQDKIFAKLEGLGHVPGAADWRQRITPAAQRFLRCRVFQDFASCRDAYDAFPHCRYGCEHCECRLCTPCVECWGTSAPAPWCSERCAACTQCEGCGACSKCSEA